MKKTAKQPSKKAAKAPSLASRFGTFASLISNLAGHPATFAGAILCLLVWGACGPIFGYSTGWQLVVNTCTTICTFLMVFIIQNSQNRDGLAAQIKLDEIIRSIQGARNTMIDLENLSDEELTDLHARFSRLAVKARNGQVPLDDAVEEELEERQDGKMPNVKREKTKLAPYPRRTAEKGSG